MDFDFVTCVGTTHALSRVFGKWGISPAAKMRRGGTALPICLFRYRSANGITAEMSPVCVLVVRETPLVGKVRGKQASAQGEFRDSSWSRVVHDAETGTFAVRYPSVFRALGRVTAP